MAYNDPILIFALAVAVITILLLLMRSKKWYIFLIGGMILLLMLLFLDKYKKDSTDLIGTGEGSRVENFTCRYTPPRKVVKKQGWGYKPRSK